MIHSFQEPAEPATGPEPGVVSEIFAGLAGLPTIVQVALVVVLGIAVWRYREQIAARVPGTAAHAFRKAERDIATPPRK